MLFRSAELAIENIFGYQAWLTIRKAADNAPDDAKRLFVRWVRDGPVGVQQSDFTSKGFSSALAACTADEHEDTSRRLSRAARTWRTRQWTPTLRTSSPRWVRGLALLFTTA
mgnify:CR=1 FL=1